MNRKQEKILTALLVEHLELTDLSNIYNDWDDTSYSLLEVLDAFPWIEPTLYRDLYMRHVRDNPEGSK